MKKIFKNFKTSISEIKESLKERPKVLAAVLLTAVMLMIFTISKLSGKTRVVYKQENTGEFKATRVFGGNGANFSDGKEKIYSKAIKETNAAILELKKEVDNLKSTKIVKEDTPTSPQPSVMPSASAAPEINALPPKVVTPPAQQYQIPAAQFGFPAVSRRQRKGPDLLSFPVKETVAIQEPLGIVLPSASYVKGKLLTGVDAPEGKPYPVLLQLDFAHILPNDHRLDLSGCFMIAKAQGDLSTERIQMQATKLSCVSRSGKTFEKDVNGFGADGLDNSFAVGGSVNSKQDRVAAMAFLSSVVEGISKSIQEAQVTKQMNPLGGQSTDVTGDQTKHLLGGGVATAAGNVTQWYLKQAEHLLPTIKVGSGQEVWIVLQDAVSLPTHFFKHDMKGSNDEKNHSYVSRLLD